MIRDNLKQQEDLVCDDPDLVARTLEGDGTAWQELMRRYTPALLEAARDTDEGADAQAAVAELWRSLMGDEMRPLRAYTQARGARLLSWLTVRLVRLVWERESDEIPGPTMMRVEDVAQRWGIDRKTVYSMISRGQLAARRCGRLVRIPRNVVESFESQAGVSLARSSQCR
jgi:excisionase family DNA binding protein